MRAKLLLLTCSVVSLAVLATLAVLAGAQAGRSQGSASAARSDASDGGAPKLTEKEIKEAVQKWWGEERPLNITKVETSKQDALNKYLIKIGDADWQVVPADPAASQTAVAVPIECRIGSESRDLLFIIDNLAVVDGPYKTFKRNHN